MCQQLSTRGKAALGGRGITALLKLDELRWNSQGDVNYSLGRGFGQHKCRSTVLSLIQTPAFLGSRNVSCL